MAPKRRTSLADMAQSKGSNRDEHKYAKLEEEVRGEARKKKRLNVPVPASLYQSFKMKCAANETSITQVVLGFIKEYVGEGDIE